MVVKPPSLSGVDSLSFRFGFGPGIGVADDLARARGIFVDAVREAAVPLLVALRTLILGPEDNGPLRGLRSNGSAASCDSCFLGSPSSRFFARALDGSTSLDFTAGRALRGRVADVAAEPDADVLLG